MDSATRLVGFYSMLPVVLVRDTFRLLYFFLRYTFLFTPLLYASPPSLFLYCYYTNTNSKPVRASSAKKSTGRVSSGSSKGQEPTAKPALAVNIPGSSGSSTATKTIKRKQGRAVPKPAMETGAPYQDPMHVREWAASSAAGMDSFLEVAPCPYPQDTMTMDPNFHLAMDPVVSQPDFAPDQLQDMMGQPSELYSGAYCPTTSATTGPSYDVAAGLTGVPDSGTDFFLVQNDRNFDGCMSFAMDNAAYPSPAMDSFSFIDSAGSHPMCNQTSSQGFPDGSGEWTSQRSSPMTTGVPMTRIGTGSQQMDFSSDFGSSPGSIPSHLISPLSMAPMDDTNWPMCDVIGCEPVGPFPQAGVSDSFQLLPPGYPEDQRFAFVQTYVI